MNHPVHPHHLPSKAYFLWAVIPFFLAFTNAFAQTNDSIPFLYHGHLFFEGTINDTLDCNILFDTGAANLFGVDSVFLDHSTWNPQKRGYAQVPGGAGMTKIRIILEPTTVNIGNLFGEYQIVPIFELRDVVDCHIDGILGIKDMLDYPLEINFEQHYIKQYKTGSPCTDGYFKMPIQYKDNRVMLEVSSIIGGKTIHGWYLMDTGSGGSIDFTAQAVEQYQMEAISGKRRIADILQFGIGDKEQEWCVDMLSDKIILGNDTLLGEPISYIPEGVGAFGEMEYLGVIGNAIWSKYNIVIDAPKGVLYLKRIKGDYSPVPTYDYGFRNRTDIGKGWIVSWLERDGDAVNAGMALGDIITAVNGKSVTDYSWNEEEALDDAPKQTIEITRADGSKIQIVLEAKKRW